MRAKSLKGVFVVTRNGRHLDFKVRKRTFALFILSHLLIYFQLHNFKVAMSGRLVAWLSLKPSWRALPSLNPQVWHLPCGDVCKRNKEGKFCLPSLVCIILGLNSSARCFKFRVWRQSGRRWSTAVSTLNSAVPRMMVSSLSSVLRQSCLIRIVLFDRQRILRKRC